MRWLIARVVVWLVCSQRHANLLCCSPMEAVGESETARIRALCCAIAKKTRGELSVSAGLTAMPYYLSILKLRIRPDHHEVDQPGLKSRQGYFRINPVCQENLPPLRP
jgi:hypothetical protein